MVKSSNSFWCFLSTLGSQGLTHLTPSYSHISKEICVRFALPPACQPLLTLPGSQGNASITNPLPINACTAFEISLSFHPLTNTIGFGWLHAISCTIIPLGLLLIRTPYLGFFFW